MDRGILMSIEGRHGVVLTKDGAFRKVRLVHPQSAQLGEEIRLSSRAFRVPKPVVSALAACLILFGVFGSLGLGERNKAIAAYISFDINPSFEAGVDQYLHVLTLHPLNKNGARVINEIKTYKNLKLEDFTKKVATVLDQDGYFKGNPNMVVSLTVTSKVQKASQKSLETQISQAVSEIRSQPQFAAENGNLQILSTTPKQRQAASNLGLTAGKYSLYIKAKEEEPSVTASLAKKMTVADLVKTAHLSTSAKESNSKFTQQASSKKESQIKAEANKPIPSDKSMDEAALAASQQSHQKVVRSVKPVSPSHRSDKPKQENQPEMKSVVKSAAPSSVESRIQPAAGPAKKSKVWVSIRDDREKRQENWHERPNHPSVSRILKPDSDKEEREHASEIRKFRSAFPIGNERQNEKNSK